MTDSYIPRYSRERSPTRYQRREKAPLGERNHRTESKEEESGEKVDAVSKMSNVQNQQRKVI